MSLMEILLAVIIVELLLIWLAIPGGDNDLQGLIRVANDMQCDLQREIVGQLERLNHNIREINQQPD